MFYELKLLVSIFLLYLTPFAADVKIRNVSGSVGLGVATGGGFIFMGHAELFVHDRSLLGLHRCRRWTTEPTSLAPTV